MPRNNVYFSRNYQHACEGRIGEVIQWIDENFPEFPPKKRHIQRYFQYWKSRNPERKWERYPFRITRTNRWTCDVNNGGVGLVYQLEVSLD